MRRSVVGHDPALAQRDVRAPVLYKYTAHNIMELRHEHVKMIQSYESRPALRTCTMWIDVNARPPISIYRTDLSIHVQNHFHSSIYFDRSPIYLSIR